MKDDFLTKEKDLINFTNLEEFKKSEKFKLFMRLISYNKTNLFEKIKNEIIDLYDEMMQNKNINLEIKKYLTSIMKANKIFKLDFDLKNDDVVIN